MNTDALLYLAAFLAILLGIAHSVLGERYILIRLFRRDDLPQLLGGTEFTKRVLRFAWHLTSVAWWGFAALMLQATQDTFDVSAMLFVIAVTFLVSGIITLMMSRGRHLAWIVFFAIGFALLAAA